MIFTHIYSGNKNKQRLLKNHQLSQYYLSIRVSTWRRLFLPFLHQHLHLDLEHYIFFELHSVLFAKKNYLLELLMMGYLLQLFFDLASSQLIEIHAADANHANSYDSDFFNLILVSISLLFFFPSPEQDLL